MATVIKELEGFVCVGSSGKSFYSTDGINWTAMSGLVTSYTYNGVTYGNDRFVCVGSDGTSRYSTDGTSWTKMTGLNTLYTYYGVAYGNDRFVCVGTKGKSFYSTDGINWEEMTDLISDYSGVAYGNGRFVCVGSSGNSYYSTDGINWVAMSGISSSASNNMKSVAYGNGRFVCVGATGKSYYSTDGLTWTAMTGLNTSYTYYGVAYGNDRFVCVGNRGTYYSTNGTSWTAMSGINWVEQSGTISSVAYGNGRFVCVSADGNSYYSTDGINWTAMAGLNTSYNYYGVTSGIIPTEVEIHPQIILGTNKTNILKLGAIDLIKAYLGTNLVYEKKEPYIYTDFTSSIVPTSWITTSNYSDTFTSENDYGEWTISSSRWQDMDHRVNKAFDGRTQYDSGTSWWGDEIGSDIYSIRASLSTPEGVAIRPTQVTIYNSYIGNLTISGVNVDNGTTETLTTIAKTSSNVGTISINTQNYYSTIYIDVKRESDTSVGRTPKIYEFTINSGTVRQEV